MILIWIFLHAWNIPALNENERCFQKDENEELPDDLNRAFISEKKKKYDKEMMIAKVKDRMLMKLAVIDVHNSELLSNCVIINNDVHALAYVNFCKKYDINYIVIESITDTIKKFAIGNNQIGFTVEIGDMNFSNNRDGVMFLEKLVEALYSEYSEDRFIHLRMKNNPLSAAHVSIDLVAHSEGLLRSAGEVGKPNREKIFRKYTTGEVMFLIMDPRDGEVKERIEAPYDCVLIDMVDSYWVSPNAIIGSVQPIL